MFYEKVMNGLSSIPLLPLSIRLGLLFVAENIYNLFYLKNVDEFEKCHFYDKITNKDGKGKVCIVTGGNSGIGYETSLQLAKLGYKIILACAWT